MKKLLLFLSSCVLCVALGCGPGSAVNGSGLEGDASGPPIDFGENAAFQEALDFQENGAVRFAAVFDEGEAVAAFDTWELALDESVPGTWRVQMKALLTQNADSPGQEASGEVLVYEGLLVLDTDALTKPLEEQDALGVQDALSFVKEGGVTLGEFVDANWPSAAVQLRVFALFKLSLEANTEKIEASLNPPSPVTAAASEPQAVANLSARASSTKALATKVLATKSMAPVDYSEDDEDKGGQETPSHAQEQCIGGFDTIKAENQGFAVRGEKRSCWAWVLGALGAVGGSLVACSAPCIVGAVAGAGAGAPLFGIGAIPGAIAGCVGATVVSAATCIGAVTGAAGVTAKSLCCHGRDVPNVGYTGCGCGEQFADTNYDRSGYSYSMPKKNNPHRQCVHCPRGTFFVQEAQNGAGACLCNPNDPSSKPKEVKCGSQEVEWDPGNNLYAREAVCGGGFQVCQDVRVEPSIIEQSGDKELKPYDRTLVVPAVRGRPWVTLPNLTRKAFWKVRDKPYSCSILEDPTRAAYTGFISANKSEGKEVELHTTETGQRCWISSAYMYPGVYYEHENDFGYSYRVDWVSQAQGPTYWCDSKKNPIGPKPPKTYPF